MKRNAQLCCTVIANVADMNWIITVKFPAFLIKKSLDQYDNVSEEQFQAF